jgi:hypothetical protein
MSRRRSTLKTGFLKDRLPRCLSQNQRADYKLPSEPQLKEKYPYDTTAWKEWLVAKRAGIIPEPPEEE